MVKRNKFKGGTSLDKLRKFVTNVEITIPYVETDDLVVLEDKITKLLEKKDEYKKLLNKINELTLVNYKESEYIEYIEYSSETPYIIENYLHKFILKYNDLIKLNDIIKNYRPTYRQTSNFPNIYEECPYIYITYINEIDKYKLRDTLVNFDLTNIVANNDSYLKISKVILNKLNILKNVYIPIARLFIVPNNFITNDPNETILFMCIYEKSLNPYSVNNTNDSLIEELLKIYNTTEKKKSLLLFRFIIMRFLEFS